MFFKKKLYDLFGEDSRKVKFFYKTYSDFFDIYKKNNLINGVFIED
jgi:hypothetical protein